MGVGPRHGPGVVDLPMRPARPSSGRLPLVVAFVIEAVVCWTTTARAVDQAAAPARFETQKTKVTTIVDDLPQVGAIAVKPTGQAVLMIDGGSNAIEMIDPAEPTRRQRAVGPFGGGERPVAVACVDSITCAVVIRSGRDWAIKTYRLPAPGTEVDPASTLQSIQLGQARADEDAAIGVAVSPLRSWIVVAGLPAPMPPVIRGAIAGARIGGMSTRNCPRAADGKQPEAGEGFAASAVAISPSDELVLFERSDSGASTDRLAMYSTVGTTQLLSLDSGLPRVRAAAYAKETLWAVGGNPADEQFPEGLWRLDAAIQDRRQVVRPVCVARLAAPVAVASLSNGRLLVVHGGPQRTVSVVEPAP